MDAVGLLMVEHRLIEKMVSLLKKEADSGEMKRTANAEFIHSAVDFFRTYADKMHHGKEEGILFRELGKKELKPEHKAMVGQWVEEHVIARGEVKGLEEAAHRYEQGDRSAIESIIMHARRIAALYPPHIKKEDQNFFLLVREYFSEEERGRMADESNEFDKGFAQEKYSEMVEKYEKP